MATFSMNVIGLLTATLMRNAFDGKFKCAYLSIVFVYRYL